jgi:dolichol-phosphate mannosyltransferase
MKTLVVMPTYNEAKQIELTIQSVLSHQPAVSILVVDDNSPDGTSALVARLATAEPRVSLLTRSRKQGLGTAYLAGFEWAFRNQFELIVEMDADGSHRAEDLGNLLEGASGADLVIGSRWVSGGRVENWPISRRLISKAGNLYARTILGTDISDMTSGFRVYRSEFLKKLIAHDVSSHGYSFQVELAHRASLTGVVIERPITFMERANGESKMTLVIVLEALTKVTMWGIRRIFS